MSLVCAYRGYDVVDSGVGYLLIIPQHEWDFVQEPFGTKYGAKRRIDELMAKGMKTWLSRLLSLLSLCGS